MGLSRRHAAATGGQRYDLGFLRDSGSLIGFIFVLMNLTHAVWAAFLMAAIVGSGCGSSDAVAVNEHHEVGDGERSVARLEIEGMMCEVACGGKISKELIEVPGVAHARIDFDTDRDFNFVEVEFDPKRVEPANLAAAVDGIADGKLYKVHEVDVTHFAEAVTLVAQ